MTPDVELAVLGGGCAGRSLLLALARSGHWQSRTAVVEREAEPPAGRTWCFWREEGMPLAHLVSREWTAVELRDGARRVRMDCREQPYQMITGADFHAHAASVLGTARWLESWTGEAAADPRRRGDGLWQVDVGQRTLVARHVVDTRPPRHVGDADALLWQSFLGVEIACDASLPEPGLARLMHFLPCDGHDLRFVYLLPLAPGRMLVEVTVFGPRRLQVADLEAALQRAIAQHCSGPGLRILRREHGILPMGLQQAMPPPATGLVRAGLMHGSARASTGYAFQRIQRWAVACAAALEHGRGPRAVAADPRWLSWMDRLFLEILREHPTRGAALFMALFEHVPPATLLRFLGRGDRLRDALAVARVLPAGLFLPQLWRRHGQSVGVA